VKKRSKHDGQFFPVVNVKILTKKEAIKESKKTVEREGDLTIAELSKSIFPNPNATASKAVVDMLDLVQSLLPTTLEGILDESNVARGGLLEARFKLQMLQAITEANNEEVNSAIVLAMRVCRLVAHEVYRPTEEFIGKGVTQTRVGQSMAESNKIRKFEISREQLLKELRDAKGANHKERCASVGSQHGRRQRTIETLCSSLGITARDYKKKS
jgi:hypothetical protein